MARVFYQSWVWISPLPCSRSAARELQDVFLAWFSTHSEDNPCAGVQWKLDATTKCMNIIQSTEGPRNTNISPHACARCSKPAGETYVRGRNWLDDAHTPADLYLPSKQISPQTRCLMQISSSWWARGCRSLRKWMGDGSTADKELKQRLELLSWPADNAAAHSTLRVP
ncbi:hypothetical protein MPH_12270 [Macrophomina phaseolina MS6]|uniref:Uncharacterized protein n=1 Tax=Macrophomina phaseolina (strain MS6) TaxID=1126212 RepID=K2R8E7_MACPH|nr:hypothetical protein MPH_12270 [Macrophomina phaseolina MS6]